MIKSINQILIFAFVILIISCSDNDVTSPGLVQHTVQNLNAKYALEWMDIEYAIIADQHRDSPPPPSRLYAYSCITIYECVVPGITLGRSLSGQLNSMPPMPMINPAYEYDWPAVIAGAMPVIIENIHDTLFPNALTLIDQKYNSILQERRTLVAEEVIQRSLQHGISIANKIIEWASGDRYDVTRTMKYVAPPRSINPAYWEPINPGDSAVEPYWGTLRTFAIPGPSQFQPPSPVQFSTDPGSAFYLDVMEVYDISHNLTLEQRRIAEFWNDKVRTGTPSGHWVSIMNQIARTLNLKLDQAARMYALMGCCLGDAFISAWSGKYKYNLLRPQSYIHDYIDSNWFPFLITPSFPEYPSGHSVVSGACSEVMTSLFGNMAFTDYTHNSIGYQPRSFSSFYDAANEAGFSRIYGGIHYRTSILKGLEIGRQIGRFILNKIKLDLSG